MKIIFITLSSNILNNKEDIKNITMEIVKHNLYNWLKKKEKRFINAKLDI